jgi:PAS domain S-box-containing protein
MAIGAVDLLKLAQKKVKNPSAIIDCFDFSVVLMSKECAKALGYSPSDVTGKGVFNLGSMSEDYVRNQLLRTVKLETVKSEETERTGKYKVRTGRKIHFKVDFTPMKVEDSLYIIVKIRA